MGLQSFEHGLERMVEGVFSRGSRSSIRPVELGRRVLREIDDHRSVDVKGRRIVPNVFAIRLSARDHAAFADIDEALISELCETAREYARAEGYHFMGPVHVELIVDNGLKPGRFSVASKMKEAGGGAGQVPRPNVQLAYRSWWSRSEASKGLPPAIWARSRNLAIQDTSTPSPPARSAEAHPARDRS